MRFPSWSTLFLALSLFVASSLSAQLAPPVLAIPYGKNAAAGKFAEISGIKIYFEVYGEGPVLLAIHGNGGTIADLGNQIQFFADRYRVIAADSRGHGQSGLGPGRLTYEQQMEDLNTLLDQLQVKSAYVLGWSDGGIIGLLLAIHHPEKVGKLAVMGANLEPNGAYPWALDWLKSTEQHVDAMIAEGDKSEPWSLFKQHLDLLGKQPNIPTSDLAKIAVPTLVMAGDKDVIRDEHTLLIFHSLKQAHLAIFPGATHMIAWDNPKLFNSTVETFFGQPFTRPDTRDIFK